MVVSSFLTESACGNGDSSHPLRRLLRVALAFPFRLYTAEAAAAGPRARRFNELLHKQIFIRLLRDYGDYGESTHNLACFRICSQTASVHGKMRKLLEKKTFRALSAGSLARLLTGLFQVRVLVGEPSDRVTERPPHQLTRNAGRAASRRFVFPRGFCGLFALLPSGLLSLVCERSSGVRT
jgi:hypothetical protein